MTKSTQKLPKRRAHTKAITPHPPPPTQKKIDQHHTKIDQQPKNNNSTHKKEKQPTTQKNKSTTHVFCLKKETHYTTHKKKSSPSRPHLKHWWPWVCRIHCFLRLALGDQLFLQPEMIFLWSFNCFFGLVLYVSFSYYFLCRLCDSFVVFL